MKPTPVASKTAGWSLQYCVNKPSDLRTQPYIKLALFLRQKSHSPCPLSSSPIPAKIPSKLWRSPNGCARKEWKFGSISTASNLPRVGQQRSSMPLKTARRMYSCSRSMRLVRKMSSRNFLSPQRADEASFRSSLRMFDSLANSNMRFQVCSGPRSPTWRGSFVHLPSWVSRESKQAVRLQPAPRPVPKTRRILTHPFIFHSVSREKLRKNREGSFLCFHLPTSPHPAIMLGLPMASLKN